MSSADNAHQRHHPHTLQANWHLARLLGWTAIFDAGGVLLGTPLDGAPNSRGQALIPDWCNDSAACFALLADFSGDIAISSPALLGGPGLICIENEEVAIDEHPDQLAAIRYCIVMHKIAQLEGKT